MREIIFRGKRTDNGEWVEGSLIQFEPKSVILFKSKETDTAFIFDESFPSHLVEVVISETVGQYTGLTDKNGTKIFEGDILNCYSHNGVNDFRNCVVVWSELFLSFKADKSLFGDRLQTYEVIGNIHDNPELLKGGD